MSDTAQRSLGPNGDWLNAEPLRKVFAAFDAAHADVRAVGGAVRNSLMGRMVTEVDLATPLEPSDVITLAEKAGLSAHPTGIDHGTVTLVANGTGFEVTTLRRDVETDGRHAVVAFATSWEEDARRRDFTINALYCDADGAVYDPIGGLADLRRHRVRFIGDAEARIREDYLRILRFFRFSAEYGSGRLDADGVAAAVAMKDGLKRIAAERIGSEMMKLLAAPHAAEVIKAMHQTGILGLVLTDHCDPGCLARLEAIEAALGQPPDALAGLAALAVSNPMHARVIAERLRLSNADTEALRMAAAIHRKLDPSRSDAEARTVLYALGETAFRRAVRVAWARSEAPVSDAAWRRRALLADRWSPPRMPFGGSDVIALGIAAGPAVGKVLKAFEAWWIDNDFPRDRALQELELKALVRKVLG
ncbi:CCA tRNA nucleotidyltransferase [Hyphomicrobium sp.]|jgi:poly(A) polymerase|uniref:CCA tRNA nucleotidyltransferase n=1 Tax=Hyphomicrobium sp. TaxID=82 RepID=UPI002C212F56|nr:CCA tRNA nucleotidyltransferase [Hyphomicrobium sp.]HVZ03504.1 CCA tRNA nucleotidyltransferase [Hyphomicrobium sp.]